MNVKYDFSSAPLSNERVHFFMSIKSNYIKFPREFTVEPFVSELSFGAKVMYVILSDRLELSEKNKEFQDEDGTPFVYFTVDDLMIVLGCSKRTVINTLKELENIGLIYRYRQYACKANKIYVRDVKKVMLKARESAKECGADFAPQKCKICTTEVQNLHHRSAKSAPNQYQSYQIKKTNQKNKLNVSRHLSHRTSTTATTTTTLILTMKIMNCNKNCKNNVTSKRNKENNRKQKKQKNY